MNISQDLKFEADYWGDCCNTFDEDQKHYVYAKYMGLEQVGYGFNVHNKTILDIGGGPSSILLKTVNLKYGKVYDPIRYPYWTVDRYLSKKISVAIEYGENVSEFGWDEVWIYNCLQHTTDPQLIINNVKRAAKVLRIFEWVNIPPHDGHPHMLTQDLLNSWIGKSGNTVNLSESGCFGHAYFGVFIND
jgi:hypothetical protein